MGNSKGYFSLLLKASGLKKRFGIILVQGENKNK